MLDQKSLLQAAQIAAHIRQGSRRRIGTMFTVDGEVDVFAVGTLMETGELDMASWTGGQVEEDLHDIMFVLYTAVMQVKAKKTRTVPVTRGEMRSFGVTRPQLDRVEKEGLIKQRIVKLNKVSGKNQPAQSVCYFTDEGRAYVRSYFDGSYGLPPKTDGTESLRRDPEAV